MNDWMFSDIPAQKNYIGYWEGMMKKKFLQMLKFLKHSVMSCAK